MTETAIIHEQADADLQEKIQMKWIGGLLMLLAVCMLVSNLTLTNASLPVFYSDLLVGGFLFALGLAKWIGKWDSWFPWAIFGLGAYLQVAPLFLWVSSAAQYFNQTMTGILAIILGALIPFFYEDAKRKAPSKPFGWSYNPSAWNQRLPVFLLCLICWFLSRYMAAYQLGYISNMWDPLFGDDGTLQVITSPLSRSFPVSDAGMGAALYAIEALSVWKGGIARWYTGPAFVLFFGLLVIPGGCISILLIMSQPLIVGHWCFWCLLTAVCMLWMIAFAVDEVVATLQFLKTTYKEDKNNFWSIFWHGGTENFTRMDLEALQTREIEGWTKGLSFPLTLVLSACIGAWLMLSPSLHGREDMLAHLEDVIGPLVITVSVIAMAEVMRFARYLNLLLGLILCFMLVFTEAGYRMEKEEALVAGLLLIFLSLPKGTSHERYGNSKA